MQLAVSTRRKPVSRRVKVVREFSGNHPVGRAVCVRSRARSSSACRGRRGCPPRAFGPSAPPQSRGREGEAVPSGSCRRFSATTEWLAGVALPGSGSRASLPAGPQGFPHGQPRQSPEGPERSIHVSSTPDRRKNSAAAMVNPHIRARAPTTTVTYDDRTLGPFPASPPVSVRYRQGRDRPCAGLRWPRTVNRGRRPLAMPSKLLPTPHSAVAAGLDIQGPRFARKRLPRARSPAAVKPLRGSFAPLRPCG